MPRTSQKATGISPPKHRIPRWRAPKPDGIGHVFPRGATAPALCGARNQPERFDQERRSRCPECERLVTA